MQDQGPAPPWSPTRMSLPGLEPSPQSCLFIMGCFGNPVIREQGAGSREQGAGSREQDPHPPDTNRRDAENAETAQGRALHLALIHDPSHTFGRCGASCVVVSTTRRGSEAPGQDHPLRPGSANSAPLRFSVGGRGCSLPTANSVWKVWTRPPTHPVWKVWSPSPYCQLAGGSDRGRGRVRKSEAHKDSNLQVYGHSLVTGSRRGHRPRATANSQLPTVNCRLPTVDC